MPTTKQDSRGRIDRTLAEYDDKERALDLSVMNLIPPTPGIFDEPARSYRLNHEWSEIVIGMVSWLAATPVWKEAEHEGYSAIEEILQFMIGYEPPPQPKLRQSPTDNCILEISYNDGETWSTAFDYSLCLQPLVDDMMETMNAVGNQILQELLDAYDQTAGSVAPNTVYDASSDDPYRDQALCLALQVMVSAMCAAELDRQINERDFWQRIPDFLRTVALVSIASGQLYITLGIALGIAVAQLALALWDNLSTAILTDTDAQEQVACAMYFKLKGSTPTETRWEDCLDYPPFSPVTNAAYIANAIRPMLDDLGLYIAFINHWSQLFTFAKSGLLDACSCVDPGWTVLFFDGAGMPPNWIINHPDPAYNIAQYEPTGDYLYAEDTPSHSQSSSFAELEWTIAGTTTIEWMTYDIHMFNEPPFNPSGQQFWFWDDTPTQIDYFNSPGHQGADYQATITYEPGTPLSDVQKIRIQARVFQDQDNRETEIRITEIRIHGTGTIPPEWEAYEV